ncbi:MAG: MotA/TolQ/ExbB proton channel family protein [Bacteroidota bacterium]|nr:MotA/TolQ/ExbB proton channel family protein [Bacteroidota bacterium]
MFTILQIIQDTTTNALTPEATEAARETLFSLILKGGWMMIPIVLLGFLGVYVYIERYITIKKASKVDPNFMNHIRNMVQSGNIEGARALCRNNATPIARMVDKGLSRIGRPFGDIRVAIENEGNVQLLKLEKGMPLMATVAGAAPMFGFLGTVTGMISAFYRLSIAGSTVGPGLVAGGIYEALVTTAAGLFVGVPAFLMYNHLTGLIDKLILHMETTTVEFIDLLEEPA